MFQEPFYRADLNFGYRDYGSPGVRNKSGIGPVIPAGCSLRSR